jgi:DNA-binding transcriptional MerR regulator
MPLSVLRKDPRTKLFSISELASEFDISPRSIRFYEEKGLISPQRTRGNQRIYTRRDRARLKLILRGKRFGYSLDEIAEMIGMTDADISEVTQIERSLAYGQRKLEEIRQRVEELEMLEQDLISIRDKLMKRLRELTGR